LVDEIIISGKALRDKEVGMTTKVGV